MCDFIGLHMYFCRSFLVAGTYVTDIAHVKVVRLYVATVIRVCAPRYLSTVSAIVIMKRM